MPIMNRIPFLNQSNYLLSIRTFLLRTFLVLLLLKLPALLFAQLTDEYIKGEIHLKNKEIKDGFIKNEDFRRMSYKIAFKQTKDQVIATTYDTSSVQNFMMDDGEIFESLRYLPNSGKDSITSFARQILKGKASLYLVFYRTLPIYIVVNNNLTYPVQDDEMPINTGEMVQNFYKSYLKNALQDDEELSGTIDKMEFSEAGIINLIKEYNKHFQSGNKIFISHFKEKPKHFFMFNADVSPFMHNQSIYSLEGMSRIYYPKFSKNTSFNIGLRYQCYKYSDIEQRGSIINFDGTLNDTTVNYRGRFLSIPMAFQENFLNGRFRPYFYVGFGFYGFFKEVNNVYAEGNTSSRQYVSLFLLGLGIEADLGKGLMLRAGLSDDKGFSLGVGFHVAGK